MSPELVLAAVLIGLAALIVCLALDKLVFDGEANAMMDWGPTYSKTHKVAHVIFGDRLPGNSILVATVTNEQAQLIERFSPLCFVRVKVRKHALTARPRVTELQVIGPTSARARRAATN